MFEDSEFVVRTFVISWLSVGEPSERAARSARAICDSPPFSDVGQPTMKDHGQRELASYPDYIHPAGGRIAGKRITRL
jgi:hypothetical protein